MIETYANQLIVNLPLNLDNDGICDYLSFASEWLSANSFHPSCNQQFTDITLPIIKSCKKYCIQNTNIRNTAIDIISALSKHLNLLFQNEIDQVCCVLFFFVFLRAPQSVHLGPKKQHTTNNFTLRRKYLNV